MNQLCDAIVVLRCAEYSALWRVVLYNVELIQFKICLQIINNPHLGQVLPTNRGIATVVLAFF